MTPPPPTTTPESSPQDTRTYLTHTLPQNSLTTLLISDPATDKSSAALDVRVGHLSDPSTIPGLAHFLEHMLFMGTEKYPDENEYNRYLNAHGGSSNAFTDMESTNYYFDVNACHLDGALDRFAQFFIGPLFTESATTREMNAVDAEHAKNVQSDFWRLFQLMKGCCRKDHPFSKFGTGNLVTLRDDPKKEGGVDVRQALLDFHARYYSANVMKLVVLGRESVDELKEMVERYFSSVPNKNLEVPQFPGTPFTEKELARQLRVVPVREMRCVEMSFPMREIDSLYLQKPTRYVSHLVGHEGKGSILALLKDLGWANELSAGESRTCSDWSSFTVSIELTDAGLEHVNDVVEIVFAYLKLLESEGPQLWIHEETSTVADCGFRFLSKRHPIDYTCSLAGAMQIYPEEHILSGPYKIYKYDPDTITECLSYLKPHNMILTITSRLFENQTTHKEKWYGTDYSIDDIPLERLERWSVTSVDVPLIGGKLHFPERNDMIASNFNLCKVPGAPVDEPRLLRDDETCRLWYKPDNVFDMPKLNVMSLLKTTAVMESPEASVMTFLWVQILQEYTTEFTYLASMANLNCSFSNARTGIEVHVSGYNHKLNVLISKIISAIATLPTKLELDLFNRIKDKASKQYQNYLFSQPYSHAMYAIDMTLETNKFSIHDKIAVLPSITLPTLVAFHHRLLSRFQLELLVHGNASPSDAIEIANTMLDGLRPGGPLPSHLPEVRVGILPENIPHAYQFAEYNAENTNSCLATIFQIGRVSLPTNAVMSLLHHIVKEPAFNELRSMEQLGYIVHTSIKTSGDDIKSLLFLIQSDSFDPVYLDGRVEAFIDRFRKVILDIGEEEFERNKDAVVKNFHEKNKNLGEESGKYWSAISNSSYLFRKYQLLGDEAKNITKHQLLIFFDKYIGKHAARRRKFSVQVFGKNHLEKLGAATTTPDDDDKGGMTIVKDDKIGDFKRSLPLFSLMESVDVVGMMMDKDEVTSEVLEN